MAGKVTVKVAAVRGLGVPTQRDLAVRARLCNGRSFLGENPEMDPPPRITASPQPQPVLHKTLALKKCPQSPKREGKRR